MINLCKTDAERKITGFKDSEEVFIALIYVLEKEEIIKALFRHLRRNEREIDCLLMDIVGWTKEEMDFQVERPLDIFTACFYSFQVTCEVFETEWQVW